jgi:Na+-driven multidrug efflux pump
MQNIRNTFFKYVSANILGMIGLSCYILADTFFIAQGVGANGLTALNLAIPVYNFMHGLGLMIGMGGATRYSISKGNADSAVRDYIFTHSLYLTLLFSFIFFILGLTCAEPLSILLGTNTETLNLTTDYLRILMIFTPFFMCNNLLICFVRNDGSPRLAMMAMLTGSFSNIFMDYLLIFPLHLGMKGAALATAASPIISIFILSFHFWKKNNQFHLRCVHPSFKRSIDICALGSSSLIVETSSGVVMLIFNLLILNISGNIGVAAYGVIANIALVLTAMYTGISQGIQPVFRQERIPSDSSDPFLCLCYLDGSCCRFLSNYFYMVTANCFSFQ